MRVYAGRTLKDKEHRLFVQEGDETRTVAFCPGASDPLGRPDWGAGPSRGAERAADMVLWDYLGGRDWTANAALRPFFAAQFFAEAEPDWVLTEREIATFLGAWGLILAKAAEPSTDARPKS